MTSRDEPILASWKISKVLETYPQLLDVLVDLTPAFRKLRNPMLRRVQTRLVTVQQAAGIAGIDPAELVRTLNAHVGLGPQGTVDAYDDAAAPGVAARPAWFGKVPVSQTLDVRPMIEQGQEPFRLITIAARAVPPGDVLRLVVGFEPLPLYDALERQGFEHWGEQAADGVWTVEFRRTSGTQARRHEPLAPVAAPVEAQVTIDVTDLVPPEPMIRVLRALETVRPGGTLYVHHVRRPVHLLERLDEMGCAYEVDEPAPGQVEIVIRKPAEATLTT
jgi:uncharacterized protein (DUF2249 family)